MGCDKLSSFILYTVQIVCIDSFKILKKLLFKQNVKLKIFGTSKFYISKKKFRLNITEKNVTCVAKHFNFDKINNNQRNKISTQNDNQFS